MSSRVMRSRRHLRHDQGPRGPAGGGPERGGSTMTRLAFRSLASRPLRTILTTLAILLGVAMITGTYVLTDQIDKGFSDIFQTSFKGTAIIVEPKTSFAVTDGGTAQTLDAGLVAQVRDVPGVQCLR